jgi:hypothetical protein
MTNFLRSACLGFKSKFVSFGVTAEGTIKRALRPDFAQSLPMVFSASGPGVARQSMGNVLTSTTSAA